LLQTPGEGYKRTLNKLQQWSTKVRGAPKAHDDYRARQRAHNLQVKNAPSFNETRFWSCSGADFLAQSHVACSDLILLLNDEERRPLMNETSYEYKLEVEFTVEDFRNGAALLKVQLQFGVDRIRSCCRR